MKIHMFIQETLAKNQKHKLGNPKINQWDTQSNKFMMPDHKIKKNTGDEKHYFKCI